MNRLLGDVKWKGKDPAEKLDPPQDTDVTVQELVDTTITEVVPVRKRQYVALTIFPPWMTIDVSKPRPECHLKVT